MRKIISLFLLSLLLTSCSFFQTHKMDIVQGNIINQDDVSRLHRGMSEAQVKEIMGTPMLTNLFSPNRVDYIYSFKAGHGTMQATRITCVFVGGRLREVIRG